MPPLVEPSIGAGSLSKASQPLIEVGQAERLRPWLASDAPALVEIFQDPAIQRWHVRRADTTAEAREWVAQWQAEWSRESGAHWAVVDQSDVVLGRVALKKFNLYDGTAEVAYWMAAHARDRGICTRAIQAVATWAFDEPEFNRLELEHSVHNPASCRVAEKAGFRPEGTRRRSARHLDGWHDMHVHSLLSEDMTAIKANATT